jgi:predicted O-methyltransferase YrrM
MTPLPNFSSPMREKIIAKWGPHILKKSIISIRGGAGVLPMVLEGKGVRTALEIGTYRGVGAAELSQYVDRVITIDLKHGKLEGNGERWDREAFWRGLGIENITQILVDDDKEKLAFVNALRFDFALIDGNHDDPAAIAADFEMVKRCGHVLFHDADRRGKPEKDRVIDFIESLPKREVKYLDIFALWQPLP